jgi:hypothetical protein
MLLTPWLQNLQRRFQRRTRRIHSNRRQFPVVTIAADVQQLEPRALLSSVLTDTTPVTTFKAVAGTSTGNFVLATFSDSNLSALSTDFTPTVNWGGTLTGTPAV